MKPTILFPAIGKYLIKLDFLTLLWQLVWEKKNSEFNPVVNLEEDGLCSAIPA